MIAATFLVVGTVVATTAQTMGGFIGMHRTIYVLGHTDVY
jgi:hypothetical protein